MKILFPNHPLKARLPDPDYQTEFDAAVGAGFNRAGSILQRAFRTIEMSMANQNESNAVRLVHSTEPPPFELEIVLKELGAGDRRFRGTTFGVQEHHIEERRCAG